MSLGGAYDGAKLFDNEMLLWRPGLGSADLDLLPDKPFLDARVRDSMRNDAFIANGEELHKDALVGSHLLLNAKPSVAVLGALDPYFDASWEKEFQEEIEPNFTLYAESPNCWLDASMRMTLTEMARLEVGVWLAGGESLATAEWMRDGRPFNTAINLVDCDRLSNPFGMFNNPKLRGGVVLDNNGVPLSYKIRVAHPADFTAWANFDVYSWKDVPARKPWGRQQVLHIVEQRRVDQHRGLSTMTSTLEEVRMRRHFRKIMLQNAVVQATYAASIESDLPSEAVFTQLGGGNLDQVAFQNAIESYATGFLGAVGAYSKGGKNLAIDGVKVPHLFPGTKLQMRPASTGDGMGEGFEQSLLRYEAAAMGVSYEEYSKDFSRTNYSSGQMSSNLTWRRMMSEKRRVADRFMTFGYRLLLEEMINKNALKTVPSSKAHLFYSGKTLGMGFEAISACDWIGASRGQTDQLKETQAAIQRILFGLSTWEAELGRLGKDWRQVFAQIQREQTDRDERGILQNIGSDMANATTGAASNKEPGEGTTATGQEAGAGGGTTPAKKAPAKKTTKASAPRNALAENLMASAVQAAPHDNGDDE